MYYTWRQDRINAKLLWWGPEGVGTTWTIHRLAEAVREKVEAGEAEPPGEEKAVGMRRNHRPVEIDETDRKLTVYFFHPSGELGAFEGHELHYKCVTPEGELEENRAYAGVFDGVSLVVLTLDARREQQDANRDAVERLAGHLARRFDVEAPTTAGVLEQAVDGGDQKNGVAMVVQVNRVGAASAVAPEAIVTNLRLPDVEVVETHDGRGEEMWRLVEQVREALEGKLQNLGLPG